MEEWVVISNNRIIQRFNIDEGQVLFIGRGADSNVKINNASVSRKHASLELRNGFYFLTDWHSTNGTWVNGERIQETKQVITTDLMSIGKFMIKPSKMVTNEVEAGSTATMATEQELFDKTLTAVPILKRQEPTDETLPPQKRLLTVLVGDVKPNRLVLRGKPISVGKDPSCDLVVTGGLTVGKIQFSIELHPQGYYILPQGGMLCKTQINGEKLTSRKLLKAKDVIEFGKVKIRVS